MMFIVYLLLAFLGGAGTWYFDLQPMEGGYLAGWFANPASSSAAVDLVVVAIAVTLPLFLAWRERHLRRTTAAVPTLAVRS